jgi:hypothetical protein
MVPCADEGMVAYSVGIGVNRSGVEGEELIKAVLV